MERHLEGVKTAAGPKPLKIPDVQSCLEILRHFGTYPNIISHCQQVARVAGFLAKELNRQGLQLNEDLIQAGALLHDVAKAYSIEHPGVNHALKGAEWVRKLGYPEVAEIVATHVDLPDPLVVDERAIVNYADKRVKHDKVVSLKERFEDLLLRYGHSLEQRQRIQRLYERTSELERLIFKHLPFGPDFINQIFTSKEP